VLLDKVLKIVLDGFEISLKILFLLPELLFKNGEFKLKLFLKQLICF
jgi:hypothetical protein